MNVPVASEFPGARDCYHLCSWGHWSWVKSRGQRPGPGLPDQSLKCQTYLGLAEFSHVSRGILPRTVDESTVSLRCFWELRVEKALGKLSRYMDRSRTEGDSQTVERLGPVQGLGTSPALPTLRSAAGLVKGCAVDTNVGIVCWCLNQGGRNESEPVEWLLPCQGVR